MQMLKQSVIFMLTVLLLASCQSSSKPGEEKVSAELTVIKPTLEPLEGYEWKVNKDNVTIAVAPVDCQTACVYQRSLKKVFELLKPDDGTNLYKVTDKPARLELNPDELVLKLTVTNNLSHVLRFHGAVLTMSVDGKNVPIDAATQDELLRAVMTPYTTLDMVIKGPKLSSLRSASTVSLGIYDVISAVDEANNPTRRTAFEWIFSVRPVEVRQQVAQRVSQDRFTEVQATKVNNSFVM